MDLIEMIRYDERHDNLANSNDGIRYHLTVIDCFTRKAWVKLLENKRGPTVLAAIKSVIAEANQGRRKVKSVFFDKGID